MPTPPTQLAREQRDIPPWASPREALVLILKGRTFATASRVSLVVGTLITTVNQGGVLLAGEASALTAVRMTVNYVVPYFVASIGNLAPFRRPRAANDRQGPAAPCRWP